MKAWRRLGIAAGSLVALLLLAILASLALVESEEVIRLHTRDASGETYTTRVWIVDYEGRSWVAPGNRSNAWFQRLLVDPTVEIERDGSRACFRAAIVKSPNSIPVLERLLEKYDAVIRATGLLNLLLEPGGDESPAVAIRLDPVAGGCKPLASS